MDGSILLVNVCGATTGMRMLSYVSLVLHRQVVKLFVIKHWQCYAGTLKRAGSWLKSKRVNTCRVANSKATAA